jgi:murein DD-endopeptidase MepM/ murein hydrolase activator NlpD
MKVSTLHRSSATQNPLDLVNSIAAGRVVHTSLVAGRSNYGKYVVVEHRWEDSLIYSLYAHLADVSCQVGDLVQSGTALGKMGYTGAGIDRIRAHCHLELGLLMSTHYEDWHQKLGGGINHHGNFNGMNLSGTDVAHFLMAQKNNPELQLSQFIATIPTYFKVTFPSRGVPDFLKRYPWLSQSPLDDATSWEISFSATGQPLAFKATTRAVTSATITSIRPSKLPHSYLTRGLVTGVGDQATLTLSGKKLVAILTDEFSLLP